MNAGHKVITADEAGVEASSTGPDLLDAARRGQFEIVVADRETLNTLLPESGRRETYGRVLVYLHAGEDEAALAVVRLFDRYKRLTPGRLYSVSPQRVKVSQLPTSTSF